MVAAQLKRKPVRETRFVSERDLRSVGGRILGWLYLLTMLGCIAWISPILFRAVQRHDVLSTFGAVLLLGGLLSVVYLVVVQFRTRFTPAGVEQPFRIFGPKRIGWNEITGVIVRYPCCIDLETADGQMRIHFLLYGNAQDLLDFIWDRMQNAGAEPARRGALPNKR
jgi:hypothetical protein